MLDDGGGAVAEQRDAPARLPDDLDERKARILRSIVAEYVANGQPVGSTRVVDTAGLDVSSATVRNEMAALEERGYIDQPHTSAGRIPTDKGYRAFVDLLEISGLDSQRAELIDELLGSARDAEELMGTASAVLAQLTRLVAMVVAPAMDEARCKLVELVALGTTTALLLVVDDTGRVVRRNVEMDTPVTEADVARVRTVLAEQVIGRRMADVHATIEELVDQAPAELRPIMQAVRVATEADLTVDLVRRVFVGGQASLAGDESLERSALGQVLALIEERATLARVLDDTAADTDGPRARIGAEHDLDELKPTSLVSQRYQVVRSGSLGVLGPTRMDYGAALSTVRAVSEALERMLADLRGPDRTD
jgi:heat-inducible transcriptional repressor